MERQNQLLKLRNLVCLLRWRKLWRPRLSWMNCGPSLRRFSFLPWILLPSLSAGAAALAWLPSALVEGCCPVSQLCSCNSLPGGGTLQGGARWWAPLRLDGQHEESDIGDAEPVRRGNARDLLWDLCCQHCSWTCQGRQCCWLALPHPIAGRSAANCCHSSSSQIRGTEKQLPKQVF